MKPNTVNETEKQEKHDPKREKLWEINLAQEIDLGDRLGSEGVLRRQVVIL